MKELIVATSGLRVGDTIIGIKCCGAWSVPKVIKSIAELKNSRLLTFTNSALPMTAEEHLEYKILRNN